MAKGLRRAVRASLIAILGVALAFPALAQTSPFVPPPAPKAKIVRLLAASDLIDPGVLADYEKRSGWAVAYDAYDSAETIGEKWREGPYDLVALPGPALARRLSALTRLDRSKLPYSRAVQAAVAAKLAAYDPSGAFAIPFGWSAFGLLYDADKVVTRLGGAPTSWSQLLTPREAAKMADCGAALPSARDGLFIAAWRVLGVDPARATLNDVKAAGALLERARPALQSNHFADPVSGFARGAICLSAGSRGEAEAATQRSREGGAGANIRFAIPREGGAVALAALAIPRDAPNPEPAYGLLDFLERSDSAARDAQYSGTISARDPTEIELLKRLWPEGVYDDRIADAVAAEWTRLRNVKTSSP